MASESIPRYPLEWPIGWKRASSRRHGTFSVDELNSAYKAAAKQRHPDIGGTEIEMAHINRARDYALAELVH